MYFLVNHVAQPIVAPKSVTPIHIALVKTADWRNAFAFTVA
jgi:hypothetical protein